MTDYTELRELLDKMIHAHRRVLKSWVRTGPNDTATVSSDAYAETCGIITGLEIAEALTISLEAGVYDG